jgi:hypothetical protein
MRRRRHLAQLPLAWTLLALAPAAVAQLSPYPPPRPRPGPVRHAASPPGPASSLAVVCLVRGAAAMQGAAGEVPRPLALFQRLAAGAVLRTAASSSVIVAYLDGRRFAVEPGSRAILEPGGPRVAAGQVRSLPPVPEIAELAAVMQEDGMVARAAAVRIRGGGSAATGISDLEPRNGTTVLPAALTLTFSPLAGVQRYRVEVQDDLGRTVAGGETRAPRFAVAGDALRPGTLYYWQVAALGAAGEHRRGQAVFVTLAENMAQPRQELAAAAARSGDLGLELILAEVDHRLGLRREACAELRAAAAGVAPAAGGPDAAGDAARLTTSGTAGDAALRDALVAFGCERGGGT